MKKSAIWILAGALVVLLAIPASSAERRGDLQAIKKALKEGAAVESGKEAKWFKVLVTDVKSGKETVQITFPLAIIETLINCTGEKHFKLDGDGCDVDLKALFSELKKAGPTAIFEVSEKDSTIKVWLE